MPDAGNNNGNDRVPITDQLEILATLLGGLLCMWVLIVLVQGGMVGSLGKKDFCFVTLLFFLTLFRNLRIYWPELYRQTGIEKLVLANSCIRSRLVFAMIAVVLSAMQLASQDFGKEVAEKESRDNILNFFYGLTVVEALVLLVVEALSFLIKRWNGLGDDLEDGQRTRGNAGELGVPHRTRENPDVGLRTRENPDVGLRTRENPDVGLRTRENPDVGLRTRGNAVDLAGGQADSTVADLSHEDKEKTL